MKFFEYLARKREIKLKIFEKEQETESSLAITLAKKQNNCEHVFALWRYDSSIYAICKKCLFKRRIV